MEMVESNKMHKEGEKAQSCVMRIRGMGMVRNIPTGGRRVMRQSGNKSRKLGKRPRTEQGNNKIDNNKR